jgi:hypothetical protein
MVVLGSYLAVLGRGPQYPPLPGPSAAKPNLILTSNVIRPESDMIRYSNQKFHGTVLSSDCKNIQALDSTASFRIRDTSHIDTMAVDTIKTSLSANDARILNALFDPETLPSSVAKSKDESAIDTTLPPHPTISPSQLSVLETQQNDIVRRTSSDSTTDSIEAGIQELNNIVASNPTYPSAFVNRAQLRRIRIEASLPKDGHIFSASDADVEALFTDLSRAIHLSLPSSSPTDPVSAYQAHILRTAYSHRAFLYLKASETGTDLKGLGKGELEELASKDFAAAARYGDEAAREMSVRTNPYAKMCGAIVKNALKEERKGSGMA